MIQEIQQRLQAGEAFMFQLTPELIEHVTLILLYETTVRVNNYHPNLKAFHLQKYHSELKDGQEFGMPFDRQKLQVAVEYFCFCCSGCLRQVSIERYTVYVSAKPSLS